MRNRIFRLETRFLDQKRFLDWKHDFYIGNKIFNLETFLIKKIFSWHFSANVDVNYVSLKLAVLRRNELKMPPKTLFQLNREIKIPQNIVFKTNRKVKMPQKKPFKSSSLIINCSKNVFFIFLKLNKLFWNKDFYFLDERKKRGEP